MPNDLPSDLAGVDPRESTVKKEPPRAKNPLVDSGKKTKGVPLLVIVVIVAIVAALTALVVFTTPKQDIGNQATVVPVTKPKEMVASSAPISHAAPTPAAPIAETKGAPQPKAEAAPAVPLPAAPASAPAKPAAAPAKAKASPAPKAPLPSRAIAAAPATPSTATERRTVSIPLPGYTPVILPRNQTYPSTTVDAVMDAYFRCSAPENGVPEVEACITQRTRMEVVLCSRTTGCPR